MLSNITLRIHKNHIVKSVQDKLINAASSNLMALHFNFTKDTYFVFSDVSAPLLAELSSMFKTHSICMNNILEHRVSDDLESYEIAFELNDFKTGVLLKIPINKVLDYYYCPTIDIIDNEDGHVKYFDTDIETEFAKTVTNFIEDIQFNKDDAQRILASFVIQNLDAFKAILPKKEESVAA